MRCSRRVIKGWYCIGTEAHAGHCDLKPTAINRFLSWLMAKVSTE